MKLNSLFKIMMIQQFIMKLSYWKDFKRAEVAIKTLIKSFKSH